MAIIGGNIQVADLAGMFNEGQKISQDNRKQGALSQYLQNARGGDAAAQGALYKAGAHQEAAGAQDYAQDQQGDAREQLGKVAGAYAQTKNPQLYSQMRELTKRAGLQFDMPESLTDPADLDGSVQAATAIARAYGAGSKAPEPYTLTAGGRRFDGNNNLVAEAPVSAKRTLVNVPDGNGGMQQMEYDGQNFHTPNYGGAPAPTSAPAQSAAPIPGQPMPQGGVLANAYRDETGGGDLASLIGGIVSPLGGRITSTTGGKHNTGSKHYSGGAVDIGMGRESPEQQAQILAALQSNPDLTVRDERTRPPGQKEWSGPHLHTERRGQGAPQAGRMGHTPAKVPTMTPAQRASAANAAERLKLAQRAQDRLDRKPAPDAKLVRDTRAQGESFSEIERLVDKLDKTNNVSGWSSSMLPFGEDRNTYQSTTGQLAVLLKPLIRGPGEGTWTDKDQEALERLVPKLDNYEGTNTEVIANIRSMIESKRRGLGIGASKYTVGQTIIMGGKKYRVTDVSDPNDPDLEEVR